MVRDGEEGGDTYLTINCLRDADLALCGTVLEVSPLMINDCTTITDNTGALGESFCIGFSASGISV